jgi:hypothetical protein
MSEYIPHRVTEWSQEDLGTIATNSAAVFAVVSRGPGDENALFNEGLPRRLLGQALGSRHGAVRRATSSRHDVWVTDRTRFGPTAEHGGAAVVLTFPR